MGLQLNKDDVRAYLIELAKQRKTCGYKELAEDIAGPGSYTIGNNDGNVVAGRGGEISREESKAGRPLLSVLIVNQSNGLPGDGFFKLAREEGLFHGNVDDNNDKREYTKYELVRVWDYWSTQIDESDAQEIVERNTEYNSSKTPEEKERVVKQVERGTTGDKVKKLNGYKCQVCEAMGLNPFGFLKPDKTPYIESHHVIPVSTREAGVLSVQNIITVCANHHRQMHYGDVELLDMTDNKFVFRIDDMQISVSRIKLP